MLLAIASINIFLLLFAHLTNLSYNWFYMISMGIENVLNEKIQGVAGSLHDAMCSYCEMAVIWMQNKLELNLTRENILNYVDEVNDYTLALLIKFYITFADAVILLMQLCDRLPSPLGESVVDCGGLSTLPNVSFTIGGKVFDLSPEQVSLSIWLCWVCLHTFCRKRHHMYLSTVMFTHVGWILS